jgi:hypothetical protein
MLSEIPSGRAFVSIFGSRFFLSTALRSTHSIFRNFFSLQLKVVLNPSRYKISKVDHPLDEKIPFRPGKVKIYQDFISFYTRIMYFLLRHFRESRPHVKNMVETMGTLYAKAGEIYAQNFSTTNRPRYLKHPRFIIIHTFDPHLLCIPSLHVMVVIRAYTQFRDILKKLEEAGNYTAVINEARQKALTITEAVLYIKQHSINCISAAMYAMTRFDDLFPQEEAEQFARDLFIDAAVISKDDAEAIREHIISLYRQFLEQGKESNSWEKPLLDFLASHPKK